MKTIKIISATLLPLLFLASCASVRVSADYDKSVDYTQYATYAFYKDGIDKVKINDLDKKRILKAVERELQAKGMTASTDPDILINFFTDSTENINVDQWGYGFGYYGIGWGTSYNNVYRTTEGTLYIDLIDAKRKELVWQGVGEGALTKDIEKKEERINVFVARILSKYPPNQAKK
jgi:hypothetical protein